MSATTDRMADLLGQKILTGIDFIYVGPDQEHLDVYFLTAVEQLTTPLPGSLSPEKIHIYSPGGDLTPIAVKGPLNWAVVDGITILQLQTAEKGDFSRYRFRIDDARIDPFYNDVDFSFKAGCPSDLDCKAPEHECPPDEWVDFSVDYLARDFWSLRGALLDFASLRYPNWADRLEADAGNMMAEAMSALGDEMAYYQDRISREAYLETASQRGSMRRHARLVDYNLHDGLGAFVWLDLTVSPANGGVVNPFILAGTPFEATGNDGSKTIFEAGRGILEVSDGKKYSVDVARNKLLPHIWDKERVCLPVGSTEMYLEDHLKASLPFDDIVEGKKDGKWVMLLTSPPDPAQPARVYPVRLITIKDDWDPLSGAKITYVQWEDGQALPFEMDMTVLTVRGNIVPATSGLTHTAFFITGAYPADLTPAQQLAFQPFSVSRTVEREGHDGTITHLYTLPGSASALMVWLGADPHTADPEILLREMKFTGAAWAPAGVFWTPQRTLLGVNSSEPESLHFTLDDGSWQRVVGYRAVDGEFEHWDYAGDKGVTIRFGDGEFGKIPVPGTVFRVDYRLGKGSQDNMAASTLDHPVTPLAFIDAVTNPMPAIGGMDPETPSALRQSAPQAFRTITYRAVRPEDYADAAEKLDWVQKAGAEFRWTGSWLTAFVTADPQGKAALDDSDRLDLFQQLDRYRQAGREVVIPEPIYADIDLVMEICIMPNMYAGEVKGRILEALLGHKGVRPKPGYFSPDRFTFGTLLERSSLEAAIQQVEGVRAVERVRIRRRGWFGWKDLTMLSYDPGRHAIIRLENDPLHPQRGTLKIYTHGGL